jgi:hypothetical protein
MVARGEASSGEAVGGGIAKIDDTATFFWKER